MFGILYEPPALTCLLNVQLRKVEGGSEPRCVSKRCALLWAAAWTCPLWRLGCVAAQCIHFCLSPLHLASSLSYWKLCSWILDSRSPRTCSGLPTSQSAVKKRSSGGLWKHLSQRLEHDFSCLCSRMSRILTGLVLSQKPKVFNFV